MPEISAEVWTNYTEHLDKINRRAADVVRKYIQRNGLADTKGLTDATFAAATRYGEAEAALASEMYDAYAALEGATLAPAVPAATATYSEAAEAINGVLKISQNEDVIASVAQRLSKMAGADTVLQNARRDGAEWAWIAEGETCAFCIALASQGWQPASKAQMKGGHASHIHANCDCMFAVRHSSSGGVRGYDPQKYRDLYYGADLDGEAPTAENRINAMRREFYAESKEKINAQKRSAYAKRTGRDSPQAEEKDVGL